MLTYSALIRFIAAFSLACSLSPARQIRSNASPSSFDVTSIVAMIAQPKSTIDTATNSQHLDSMSSAAGLIDRKYGTSPIGGWFDDSITTPAASRLTQYAADR